MSVPPFLYGTVISQDGDRYRVNVLLDGPLASASQMSQVGVGVMTFGPRDAVRGSYHELPTPGTRGLIAFPRGDVRNGLWVGSVEHTENDVNPGSAGVTNFSYKAAYSGYWEHHSESGVSTSYWPDGTNIVVGGETAPTLNRHVVDSQQRRTSKSFVQSERINNTPSVFPVTINHSSGTQIVIDGSGNVNINTVSSVNVNANTSVNLVAPAITLGSSGESLQEIVLKQAWDFLTSHTHKYFRGSGAYIDTDVPTNVSSVATPLTTVTVAG